MPRPFALLPLVLPLATIACTAPDMADERLGSSEDAVYLGQPTTGDLPVVALTAIGGSFCSGTVVAPRVVLTAAHCLPPHNPVPPDKIAVFFGPEVGGAGQSIPITQHWTNPGWNDNSLIDDIGLVRLSEDAPVEPMPLADSPPSLGDPVRIVGYGIIGENMGGGGLKREGTAEVDDVDTLAFTLGGIPSGTCSGDSGGATIRQIGGVDVLAGVHSRADCVGLSYEMRVDAYADDVAWFIGDPACDLNGQCSLSCPYPDPDCPCASDGYCTELCEDWSLDADCPDPCVADDYCDTSCDADPDCPCLADGECELGCTADPDCTCDGDGTCNPSCGDTDPDCQAEPCAADAICDETCASDPDCDSSAPPLTSAPTSTSGCAVGSLGATRDGRGGLALGLILGLLLRRRQKSSRFSRR
ncbi:MAG: trypsin-like serine protease [Myxococcales bacterium]|nr:trypsin-like serine protease [Myxococcales bacterium]